MSDSDRSKRPETAGNDGIERRLDSVIAEILRLRAERARAAVAIELRAIAARFPADTLPSADRRT